MIDMDVIKEKIMTIVREEGPVLPVNISRKLDRDTFFAGAVLSELVRAKKIKISKARIGSSPVYYVDGQESKLERLYEYLPGKEKEAYELLRKNQVLRDRECEPPIRVALRSIRDFSFPLEINGELFWRWYLFNEQEARKLVGEVVVKKEEKKIEPVREILREDLGDGFLHSIEGYFNANRINLVEKNVVRKQREVHGRIKVNSDLGVIDYFFIARNKKNINDADLSLASDLGRKNNLPVLFLSNGKLSKKAERNLEENLKRSVVFRKI